MAKVIKALAAGVALMILFFLLAHHRGDGSANVQGINYSTVTFIPRMLVIRAEIAETSEQVTTGLMFRKSLGKNEGMLFVFPSSSQQSFWMKNTLMPLDMVFISDNLTIVKIRHAVPCIADPCKAYTSESPAKYVLEVNGNITDEYGIKEGGYIHIAP